MVVVLSRIVELEKPEDGDVNVLDVCDDETDGAEAFEEFF